MNNVRSYYHDDADYNKSKQATPTDSNGQRKASQQAAASKRATPTDSNRLQKLLSENEANKSEINKIKAEKSANERMLQEEKVANENRLQKLLSENEARERESISSSSCVD